MYKRFGKRVFDILFSLCALIILSPLLVMIGLMVYLDIGRPVIFRQARVGREGNEFGIFKFRTMTGKITNMQRWNEKAEHQRTTQRTRFLRKHGIDELPQLLNVLLGQMSVVGPRPWQRCYFSPREICSPDLKTVLSIRPGITGPAQIRFTKKEIITDEVARSCIALNAHYARHISFRTDLWIIIKTISVVIRGH